VFLVLAAMDYSERQLAATGAYKNLLTAEGVPVDNPKDLNPRLPRETYLTTKPPDLDANSPWSDEFKRLGAGQPVNIQIKEVEAVPASFLNAVADAAKQAGSEGGRYMDLLKATPAQLDALTTQARRGELRDIDKKNNPQAQQLEEVLLLAPTGELRIKLIKEIKNTKKLGDLLAQVAARRMFAQALLPLEERRQGGHREELALLLGNIGFPEKQPAELGEYLAKLDESLRKVKKKDPQDPKKEIEEDLSLAGRVADLKQSKRDDLDRRQEIAYFLFTLSQVTKPDGTLLGTPPEQRVEAIVGRQRFIDAIQMQTTIYRHAVGRLLSQVQDDLETFATRYNWEIKDRFPSLKFAIDRYDSVLKDWDKQKKAHETQRDKRKADYKEAVDILKKEREQATLALKELGDWQQKLFQAQVRGSGVLEENLKLEKQIVDLEKGR
jgi:hypothetical protein